MLFLGVLSEFCSKLLAVVFAFINVTEIHFLKMRSAATEDRAWLKSHFIENLATFEFGS